MADQVPAAAIEAAAAALLGAVNAPEQEIYAAARAAVTAALPHLPGQGVVDLLIKLHIEEAVSEGQVAKATGLHRIEIRRLVDEMTLGRPALEGDEAASTALADDVARIIETSDHFDCPQGTTYVRAARAIADEIVDGLRRRAAHLRIKRAPMANRRIVEAGYRRDLTEAQADLLRSERLIFDLGDGVCFFTNSHMDACNHDLKRAAAYVEKRLSGGTSD